MTFTALATPVPNTKILVATFGALVKQNFDDLDGRITAIDTNLGTPWTGTPALNRINYLETAHAIRYETTTATSCTNAIDTDIPFGTAVRTDTGVFTVSGANFTCVKAGWVDAAAACRLVTGTAALEVKIKLNGNLVAEQPGGTLLMAAVATGFPVAAGDVIKVSVFHNSGSAKALETGAGRNNHIALSYRGV